MLDLSKNLGQLSKVRLRGGVVGKVTLAVITGTLTLGSIGVAARDNPWIAGGAIVAILALAVPLLWRLIGFAKSHPQAAILEGAEFLMHTQMTLASKSHGEYTERALLEAAEAHVPPPDQMTAGDQPDTPDTADTAEKI